MKAWRDKLHKANTSQEPEQIENYLADADVYVRYAAINNPNISSSQLDKALDDVDEIIRISAANHPSAEPHHIEKALMDKSASVRLAVGAKHLN